MIIKTLFPYRFELFLVSQVAILFGSLLIPPSWFDTVFSPLFFIINIVAGIVFIQNNRNLKWLFITLLIILVMIFSFNSIINIEDRILDFIKLGAYFVFHLLVTMEIIKQVWQSDVINMKVIWGLVSGYISLGLIGFFICFGIELFFPGSFKGTVALAEDPNLFTDQITYFSYVTLMTLGYGDIVPITSIARKAAVLIALVGQLYIVLVTAIVVGKYINQVSKK